VKEPEETNHAAEGTPSANAPETAGRKSGGVQIDGFFELDHKFFLVETKWTTKELPASELFAFRGRVDGKLAGTLGVVISIAGFSADAEWMLTTGHAINIILMTKDELVLALSQEGSFTEIIRAKLREAALRGWPLYKYKRQRATLKREKGNES